MLLPPHWLLGYAWLTGAPVSERSVHTLHSACSAVLAPHTDAAPARAVAERAVQAAGGLSDAALAHALTVLLAPVTVLHDQRPLHEWRQRTRSPWRYARVGSHAATATPGALWRCMLQIEVAAPVAADADASWRRDAARAARRIDPYRLQSAEGVQLRRARDAAAALGVLSAAGPTADAPAQHECAVLRHGAWTLDRVSPSTDACATPAELLAPILSSAGLLLPPDARVPDAAPGPDAINDWASAMLQAVRVCGGEWTHPDLRDALRALAPLRSVLTPGSTVTPRHARILRSHSHGAAWCAAVRVLLAVTHGTDCFGARLADDVLRVRAHPDTVQPDSLFAWSPTYWLLHAASVAPADKWRRTDPVPKVAVPAVHHDALRHALMLQQAVERLPTPPPHLLAPAMLAAHLARRLHSSHPSVYGPMPVELTHHLAPRAAPPLPPAPPAPSGHVPGHNAPLSPRTHAAAHAAAHTGLARIRAAFTFCAPSRSR